MPVEMISFKLFEEYPKRGLSRVYSTAASTRKLGQRIHPKAWTRSALGGISAGWSSLLKSLLHTILGVFGVVIIINYFPWIQKYILLLGFICLWWSIYME